MRSGLFHRRTCFREGVTGKHQQHGPARLRNISGPGCAKAIPGVCGEGSAGRKDSGTSAGGDVRKGIPDVGECGKAINLHLFKLTH